MPQVAFFVDTEHGALAVSLRFSSSGTASSLELSFLRSQVADAGMAPPPVVEDLDVIEDGCYCFCPCGEGLSINAFAFQGTKEAFGYGIVPTVAAAAHALQRAAIFQSLSEQVAGVLAAAIRVHDYRRTTSLRYAHLKCIIDDLCTHTLRHRPAYDGSCVKVDKHSQIQPPLGRPHIRQVANPHLVHDLHREILLQEIG